MSPWENPAGSDQSFVYRFVVHSDEIDALGHASNAHWIRWINDAAVAHSQAVGLTLEVCRGMGAAWVVRRHELDYLVSAYLGDQIAAETWIDEHRGATLRRRLLLRRESDGVILGRSLSVWAWIDWKTGRPRRVPADLVARYAGTVQSGS